MHKNWHLSRRTLLKGVGVSMALPLLEQMVYAGDPKATPVRAPVRMAWMTIPSGVNMDHWKPKPGTTDLPSILAPLKPLIADVLVLSGLAQRKAFANGDGAGDHARETGTILTGVQCKKTSGADIQAGISIDQVAADKIGAYTSLPSLELGIDHGQTAGDCDSGYSCAYSSNVSWRTPSTPMAKEINPRLVFERMFAARKQRGTKKGAGPTIDPSKFKSTDSQPTERSLDQSVIDLVLEDAKGLRSNLGGNDQHKLDEYLDATRALEKRIESAEKAAAEKERTAAEKTGGTSSPIIQFDVPQAIPKDYDEHVKLMLDLIVLGFQSDTTRIATFMFANGGSNRTYPQIGVMAGHHEISHHGKDPAKLEMIRKINLHHIELFTYMLTKMKAIKEGGKSLLDNCMIMYGSGIGDGDRHNHDDLPVLLAGSGGGTVKSGRHVPQCKGNMCDLFLAMLARAGCPVDTFGDGTKMLPDLS